MNDEEPIVKTGPGGNYNREYHKSDLDNLVKDAGEMAFGVIIGALLFVVIIIVGYLTHNPGGNQ